MSGISVIVPIYNVEKQLDKCIKSILKQDIEDIEIILVNDGSKDMSGDIAKKYAEMYQDKIKYFEKHNGGLSDARNYGISKATKEYISFIDSDDYIANGLYKKLYNFMVEKYDMIKFAITKVDEKYSMISKNESPAFKEKTGEEAFDILYKTDVMTEVAWAYLYKTEFIKNNNFTFEKGLAHEDFGLIPLMILKANKVASTDIDGYYYVQTSNSITRGNPNTIYKRAKDLLIHYDNMIERIKNYNISNKSIDNIKIYYTNCIILELNNLNKNDKKEYIKEIKKRHMISNIKARNLKQFIKFLILKVNINWYLKLR